MRVHLVRHGHHAEVGRILSGRSEIGLDDAGRAQAALLATMLRNVRYDAIHASPRRRCLETAGALVTGAEVKVADALDEIDFGRFAGRRFADLDRDPDWRRWNGERDAVRCPGGETMTEATSRARRFLEDRREQAGPILCVTHCDIVRGLVAQALGLRFAQMFALPCDPGSLTILELDEGRLHLVTLNALPHVADQ